MTAVEKDPDLVSRSHRLFPDVPVLEADILELTPTLLERHGRPTEYDVVVAVGNVMIYLAEDTEVRALPRSPGCSPPKDGCWWASTPRQGAEYSRDYPVERFRADAGAAGLVVQHEFGGYDLAPPGGDYVVAVLRRAR